MSIRADELLVKQGLVESRSKARCLIELGRVVDSIGITIDKPSKKINASTQLKVIQGLPYVSRGGEKLAHFLEQKSISVEQKDILDVGASTGGFTDCLLQRGARSATCVDVGHGQLHKQLLLDARVTNLEGIHAKELNQHTLPHTTYPIVVVDLSFISIQQVLATIWQRVAPDGLMITLIKPQFEVARAYAFKQRGIIKDSKVHQQVISEIETTVRQLPQALILGTLESPIKGGDGNTEFLLGIVKQKAPINH